MSGFIRHFAIIPVLLVHVWLAVGGSDHVGPTADEPIHVAAGLCYNLENDYRFQPENGNLPQRLYALPWQFAGLRAGREDSVAWQGAQVWNLADTLWRRAGNRAADLHRESRWIAAFAGVAVLVVAYGWSFSLFGCAGAWLTLLLAAFCPNLIAHSGLTTTDIWGTLGLLLSTLTWWRLLHRVSPGRVFAAGLATGFFALCKFSCVLLAPIVAALFVARLLRRARLPWRAGGRRGRLSGWRRVVGLSTAGMAAIALSWTMVWAAYDFRYSASNSGEDSFIQPWETVLIENPERVGMAQLGIPLSESSVEIRAGALQSGVRLARNHRLLPEAWLYGLAFVGRNAQSRLSYFSGEYKQTGWLEYFPMAFLLKTPLGGLLALGAGALAWAFIPRRCRLAYRLSALWIVTIILAAAAVSSRINIGLRHILPLIAIAWMAAGASAKIRAGRPRRVFLAFAFAAVAAQAAAAFRAAPHALAYFNPLAGSAPDRWLADSNLDWGQGLPELKRWLKTHGHGETIHLSYFGADQPERYGINTVRFADNGEKTLPANLGPGWYCFGATQFRRVYTTVRGPWSDARERLYQRILARVRELGERPGSTAPLTEAEIAMLTDFDQLRLARLALYLEGRQPEYRIPGGMMLFHLEERDIALAFYAPMSALSGELERRIATQRAGATPTP